MARKGSNESSGLINLNFGLRDSKKAYKSQVAVKFAEDWEWAEKGYTKLTQKLTNENYVYTKANAIALVDLVIPKTRASQSAYDQMIGVLMNKLRTVATSTVTYSPSDLKAYTLNVRSIVAEIAFIQRYLASLRSFEPYDADSPESLARITFPQASYPTDIDVTDTMNRLNSFLDRIEYLLPVTGPMIMKDYAMFSTVLKDSNKAKYSKKSYVLLRAPKYTVMDDALRAQLKEANNNVDHPLGKYPNGTVLISPLDKGIYNYDSDGAATPISALITKIEQAIADMASQHVNINIAADIFKAFGAEVAIKYPRVSPNSILEPVYSEPLLNMWENMTIMPGFPTDAATFLSKPFSASRDISDQCGPYVVSHATVSITDPTALVAIEVGTLCPGCGTKRVNIYSDHPTSVETMNALQMCSIFDLDVFPMSTPDGNNAVEVEVIVTSTPGEVVVGYYYDNGSKYTTMNPVMEAKLNGSTNISIDTKAMASVMKYFWSINDYEPALQLSGSDVLFDLKNWALVDSDNLSTMHEWMITAMASSPSRVKNQSSFNFVR